jgi:hypothetical protein
MFEESNIEDVEQSETNDEGILGDIEAEFEELEEQVEDLPALPTEEEAELGELCRVPKAPQFQGCTLIDEETPEMVEAFEGDI